MSEFHLDVRLTAEELRVVIRALVARELPLEKRAHAMHVAGDLRHRDELDREREVAGDLRQRLAFSTTQETGK